MEAGWWDGGAAIVNVPDMRLIVWPGGRRVNSYAAPRPEHRVVEGDGTPCRFGGAIALGRLAPKVTEIQVSGTAIAAGTRMSLAVVI